MAVSELDQLQFFHLSDDDFLNIYDMNKIKLSDFVTNNELLLLLLLETNMAMVA